MYSLNDVCVDSRIRAWTSERPSRRPPPFSLVILRSEGGLDVDLDDLDIDLNIGLYIVMGEGLHVDLNVVCGVLSHIDDRVIGHCTEK